jgi:hypothetical protein
MALEEVHMRRTFPGMRHFRGLTPAAPLALSLGFVPVPRADAAPPEVRVPRIDAAPRLEDFETREARSSGIAPRMTRVTGWVQRFPTDGAQRSEETEAFFGFDDNANYVAVVCHDREP